MASLRATWLFILLNMQLGYIMLGTFQDESELIDSGTMQPAVKFEIPVLPVYSSSSTLDYTEILDRPLFNEDRLPGKADESVRSLATTPGLQAKNLSLVGIVLRPEETVALLRVAGRGKQEVIGASQGEIVEGWTIKSIQEDRVFLYKGKQKLELLLERLSVRSPQARRRTPLKKTVVNKNKQRVPNRN